MMMIRIKISPDADGLALINPLQVLDVVKVGGQRYKLSLNAWDSNIKDFRHYILDDDSLKDYINSLKAVAGNVEENV